MRRIDRVLLHLADSRRLPIDPEKVYFLEAVGDETSIRLRRSRRLRDVRSLGEVLPAFEPYGFVRIHRNHAVNLRRVREIRRQERPSGWELKLAAPVNRVLPISRTYARSLFAAFGTSR